MLPVSASTPSKSPELPTFSILRLELHAFVVTSGTFNSGYGRLFASNPYITRPSSKAVLERNIYQNEMFD